MSDPDLAYPTLIKRLLPTGLRGIIICGLFASLMSSVDSIFHSVSTLWTIDIFKKYIKSGATDRELVAMGKKAIFGTLCMGLIFAYVNVYVKFENPGFALAHWFNEVSYYVKNGFVLLIICAAFLNAPSKKLVFFTLLASVALTIASKWAFPDINYLNRSTLIIVLTTLIVAIPTIMRNGFSLPKGVNKVSTKAVGWYGTVLLASLFFCHIAFH